MSRPPAILTRQISAAEVLPLRLAVLRPGRPPETAVFAGDELPTTTHWGAFEGDRCLAIATLMEAPAPGRPGRAWQIRGMASAAEARGRGFGSAALRAAMAYVAERDPGGHVWCNARVAALEFYRAHGFVPEGPEFEIPSVGPHYVMWRRAPSGR